MCVVKQYLPCDDRDNEIPNDFSDGRKVRRYGESRRMTELEREERERYIERCRNQVLINEDSFDARPHFGNSDLSRRLNLVLIQRMRWNKIDREVKQCRDPKRKSLNDKVSHQHDLNRTIGIDDIDPLRLKGKC